MKRSIVVVALLSFGTNVFAGPVLLASVDISSGQGGTGGFNEERVSLVLALTETFPPLIDPGNGLGDELFWKNGASGFVDFSAANEDDFSRFAELATNGVNDTRTFFAQIPQGVGAGSGGPESDWLCAAYPCDGLPDLAGNRLDFVRLIVHSVTFDYIEVAPGVTKFRAHENLTYEFYGTPVPEPSVLTLIGAGVFLARKRLAFNDIRA